MARKKQKKASISGMTQKGREGNLATTRHRLANSGWNFLEYKDNGVFGSYALFEKEVSGPSPGAIIGGILVLVVLWMVVNNSDEKTESNATGGTQVVSEPAKTVGPAKTVEPAKIVEPAQAKKQSKKEPVKKSAKRPATNIEAEEPTKKEQKQQLSLEEKAANLKYDAEKCVTGDDCKEWYLLSDTDKLCILIRSKSEPEPRPGTVAHAFSVEESIIADALEREIFEDKYYHLEDYEMLAEISKAWGVPADKLKEINLKRDLLEECKRKSTIVDLREPVRLEEDVKIELNILDEKDGTPVIYGKTNLPDGAGLMVSVTNEKYSLYAGQDHAEVHHGYFVAGPFAWGKKAMAEGLYSAEVLLPLPSTQTGVVRKVIGEKGENLRGPLVEQGELGVTVRVEAPFFVGPSRKKARRSQKKWEAEVTKEVNDIYRRAKKLEKKGRDMEPLRDSGNRNLLSRCGERMRTHQARAKKLRARMAVLPRGVSPTLATAAARLELCVSCSLDALDWCKLVRLDLKKFKHQFSL